MAYKYTFQGYDKEKMARAVGISLPISYKQAREICVFVKNKEVEEAKKLLNSVLKMKIAVPFKRFNMNVGHKPGNIAAGRFPQNASMEILKLIESAEKNASNKGLNNLFLTHACSHRAAAGPRSGRTPGEAKRSHVEVVIIEKKVEKKKYIPRKERKTK